MTVYPVLQTYEKEPTKVNFTVNQLSHGLTSTGASLATVTSDLATTNTALASLTTTVNGLVVTVATGLSAAGTTQGTATVLAADWNGVNTVVLLSSEGVRLNASADGKSVRVWNFSVNSLNVYPPSGATIDNLGMNNPYVLAAGKQQIYSRVASTFYSSQTAASMG